MCGFVFAFIYTDDGMMVNTQYITGGALTTIFLWILISLDDCHNSILKAARLEDTYTQLLLVLDMPLIVGTLDAISIKYANRFIIYC